MSESLASNSHIDIALVGIGCQFSQSPDVAAYWQNIVRGFNAIREVPAERWREDLYYSPDRQAPDKLNSKWGSFLDDVVFDPLRYHMPPSTLQSIEPVQLLSLEAARHALEDAGYGATADDERKRNDNLRTAVIFAVAPVHDRAMDYAFRTMCPHYLSKVKWLSVEDRQRLIQELHGILPEWTEDSFAGYLPNVVAGRITNRLNLGGTNLVVDAACAASLAALHVAINELRSHAADVVIAGAADGTNNPMGFMSFAKTYALTSSGQPRPFDDSADGIALGEGVAAVVLKRLVDAERDGDRIYAVIKGMGSSSDGRNRSLTAPSPEGQVNALQRAYVDAGVDPQTVTLVEGHGTGTAVGDRTEITSLQTLFSANGCARQSCAIGSVKSMIGHTKIVAGMASLIKTAMALKHRVLPPTINVTTPNRQIDFATSPFYINTEARPWITAGPSVPRRAGLSAFGFGGTNFHVVLEEYIGDAQSAADINVSPREAELFVWRRADRSQLVDTLESLLGQIAQTPAVKLAALASAVAVDEAELGASASMPYRLAIVASSLDELQERITLALPQVRVEDRYVNPKGIYFSSEPALDPQAVCFLFPGQGSQCINALRDLTLGCPELLSLFERANEELRASFDQPLSQFIYPVPTFDAAEARRFKERLDDTRVAQPALGVLDLFASRLLSGFGVIPGMAAGHSYGELVALCVAGVLSEQDLLRLSAVRGAASWECSQTTPGRMAAVSADGETTSRLIEELKLPVRLANLNSPRQTIIAGEETAIDQAVAALTKSGLRAKKIAVTAAFHTPAVDHAAAAIDRCLGELELQPPQLPVWNNTTAAVYPSDVRAIRETLVRHIVSPVLFDQQVREMFAAGARLFIEVGPGSVLTGLVGQILQDSPHTAISVDAAGRNGWIQLAHVLGQCVALGLPVNVRHWFRARQLSSVGVTKLCETERAKAIRKPTDWFVNGGQARPCFPPVTSTANGEPATPEQEPPVADVAAAPAPMSNLPTVNPPQPVSSSVTRSRFPIPSNPATAHSGVVTMTDASNSHSAMIPVSGSAGQNSEGLHALLSFQQSMSQWMQLQGQQLAVTQQFLQTQERLVMAMVAGGGQVAGGLPNLPVPALPVPTAESSSTPTALPAAPKPTRVLPASTVRRVQATAPARRESSTTVAAPPARGTTPAKAAPAPAKSAPVAHKQSTPSKNGNGSAHPPATSNGDGPPSTEEFRTCLLNTVMQRTGYPVEMLDEDLPLESGLGIDSIKTLEIFNALKDFHPYLRDEEDQEQEDLIADFAQLRTLGQIINAYDTKRMRFVHTHANGSATSNGYSNGATAHESASKPAALPQGQRFALAATSSPVESNGDEKKNSSPDGTSS